MKICMHALLKVWGVSGRAMLADGFAYETLRGVALCRHFVGSSH